MSNIPKKVLERFSKNVPRYQKVLQIAKDRDVNESDTVSVLNDMLGDVFGYDRVIRARVSLLLEVPIVILPLKLMRKYSF